MDAQSLIRSRWDEEKRIAEFEKQAAARELLGGGLPTQSRPENAKVSSDSIFQTSAGTSGTATPLPGAQQTIPMSAPPPKQITASTLPQYEVEEVDDLVTAPR